MLSRFILILMLQVSVSLCDQSINAAEDSGNNSEEATVNAEMPSNLKIYLDLAVSNNAGLKAAFEDWEVKLAIVPQAESLSDPRFNFSYFIDEVETKLGPQKSKFGISQTFPWFGKLQAKKDVAFAKAEAARYAFENKKLQIFYEVKKAYFEFAYVGEALELAKENKSLVEHYEAIARTKYETSTANHPDVIRAQIELAIIDNTIETLSGLKSPLVSQLESAINVSNVSESITFEWPSKIEPVIVKLDEQVIINDIYSSPLIQSKDKIIEAGEASVLLAKKKSYPDITVGVDWINIGKTDADIENNGRDAVAVMFGMNIPLWGNKNNALREEAIANVRGAEFIKVQQFNDQIARVDRILYDIEEAKRNIALYRDVLLPKADVLVETSEAAYRTGTLEFLSLIDAQKLRLKYMLNYERAVVDYMQTIAELEMVTNHRYIY